MPLIRNRTSMPGFDTSRRYWNAIMAIWIWRWRRTMREKARWTGRTESRPFERHGVTYKKFRMLIFGQDRGALKECGRTRARSARTWMRLAGLFSRTSSYGSFLGFLPPIQAPFSSGPSTQQSKRDSSTTQDDAFTGSERGRKYRTAPLGMTGMVTASTPHAHRDSSTTQDDAFTGSERGRKRRPAPLGMTGVAGL